MIKLRRKTFGVFLFWGLALGFGAVACGSSFDSGDCKASHTCPASAGSGDQPSEEAGSPSGGSGDTPENVAGASGETQEPTFGGEGGAGGQPVALNPPPTVISVTPTDAQPDIEPDAVVKITFSEPLAASSVTASSIKLLLGTQGVEGDVSYADSVVTFTPKRPLGLLGDYSVSVTTAVTDVEGAALAASFASQFVVRDGKFYLTTAVEEDAQYLAASVPVEPDGSVLLAWSDRAEGDDCPVLAQRFLRGAALGSPQPLSKEGATSCGLLSAAASPNGVSAVSWAQFSGDPQTGHVRQYRDGKWSPDEVPTTDSAGSHLTLGIGKDGAVSLFQNAGTVTTAYRSNATGEWSGMKDDLGPAGETTSDTALAFDEAGNGLAVWASTKSNVEQIYASRFTAASAKWGVAVLVPGSKASQAGEGYDRGGPALAVAPNGSAVAMWVAVDGPNATPQLMVSNFDSASGWTNAAPIGEGFGGLPLYNPPALVFDGQTFVAAFTAEQPTKLQTLVTRWDPTTGVWSVPEKRQAAQDPSSGGYMPKLATDGRGHLVLVWPSGTDSAFRLYYQRYAGGAWTDTKAINQTATANFYYASLSSNADGLGALAWTESDGAGFGAAKIQLASFY